MMSPGGNILASIPGSKTSDPTEEVEPRSGAIEDVEFDFVVRRRVKSYLGLPTDDKTPRPDRPSTASNRSVDRNLVGLAFSGGGIRSATFGLGVLQGLAELDLLDCVDYLSTVSGGGFIGSWFAAWIKREGDLANVAKQLKPRRVEQAQARRGLDYEFPRGLAFDEEPEPIFHLRAFSNYLSPRWSFFSGDSWTLVAIYLRNLFANLLVLLPCVIAVLIATRIIVRVFVEAQSPAIWFDKDGLARLIVPPNSQTEVWSLVHCGGVVTFVLLVVFAFYAYRQSRRSPFVFLVSGSVVVAVLLSFWLGFLVQRLAMPSAQILLEAQVVATLGPPIVLLASAVLATLWTAIRGRQASEQEREWLGRLTAWFLIIASIWSAVFAVSLYGSPWFWQASAWLKSVLAVGWLSAALGGIRAAQSAKTDGSQRNSWLDVVSRVAPVLFLFGLGCAMSVAVNSMIDPAPSDALRQEVATNTPVTVSPRIVPTQITTTSTITPGAATPTEETTKKRQIVESPDEAAIDSALYWRQITGTPIAFLLWLELGVIVIIVLAALRVDINAFSLNAMYANRLVRCYLGASRQKRFLERSGAPNHSAGPPRAPHPVTGFDPADDLELRDLRIGELPKHQAGTADPPAAEKTERPAAKGPAAEKKVEKTNAPDSEEIRPYWGPFPLINTALNLVMGEQLAWQERKAESFVLSPVYCGAKSIGYRDVAEYAAGASKRTPLTVGKAIAISGAAANPNMGYHSSPAASALMTIFNVRLGWWLPNPSMHGWSATGPTFGLGAMLRELFGFTNARSRFLNISDGGHFENLAVYELVRRRCRYIIVSDAGADPDFQFEDLAGLIRKCRTDFGVDIEIDLTQLRRDAQRNSKWHGVIGTIRYDQVDPTAPVGTLIYLKPSVTGDEPADVQHYATCHPTFPHEPTLDQFFTESHFESYRALGYHCVSAIFKPIVEEINASNVKGVEVDEVWKEQNLNDWSALSRKAYAMHDEETVNLFYYLRKRWLTPSPSIASDFYEAAESFEELQSDFSRVPALGRLAREMYSDVGLSSPGHLLDMAEVGGPGECKSGEPGSGEGNKASPTVDLHIASRMLQIMENTWLRLRMNEYHAHPLNSGWLNVFQRWSNMPSVRRLWPLLRNEYSGAFVAFCERELSLDVDFSKLQPIGELVNGDAAAKATWQQMCTEYSGQWPEEADEDHKRGLDDIRKECEADRRFWFLSVSADVSKQQGSGPLVAGVIGLRKMKDRELRSADGLAGTQAAAGKADRVGYEVFIWVRPAFRQRGIGKELIEGLIYDQLLKDDGTATDLMNSLGSSFKLAVFYPSIGWAGTGTTYEKEMWLSFLSFYGFRRPGPDWPWVAGYDIMCLSSDAIS